MASISRHLRLRIRKLDCLTAEKGLRSLTFKFEPSKYRLSSSQSDGHKDVDKNPIPSFSARRSNRISVAQRLTSMLPADYLESHLDEDSKNEVETLRGPPRTSKEGAFSTTQVDESEGENSANTNSNSSLPPNFSARRSSRISVAQRLTSMLPNDYLESHLDEDSRSEVEALRGLSVASSVPRADESEEEKTRSQRKVELQVSRPGVGHSQFTRHGRG